MDNNDKQGKPEKKVVTCSVCGNMFVDMSGSGKQMCGECEETMRVQQIKIDAYLAKNPNAKLTDIAAHTNVGMDIIKRVVGGGEASYPCKKCGAPIFIGQYCRNCQQKLQKALTPKRSNTTGSRKSRVSVTLNSQSALASRMNMIKNKK